MTGPAMQKALDQIGDAFRPERKERQAIILTGHRVKTLVQDGRYSFAEACRLLKLSKGQVAEAFKWLVADNARMNAAYNSEVHGMNAQDYFMLGFINHEEAPDHDGNVVSLRAS